MRELTRRLNAVIPGGAHTYSKGHDQFPINSPALIKYGKGAWLFDEENNEYLDCAMGLTSVSIGHGDDEIATAVYNAALLGANYSKPALLELEAAEFFLSNVAPQHDMVKFTKNGSTATTAALKLARAFTGREKVLVPAQFPFFSYDDWFIAGTVANHGTQLTARSQVVKFDYGDLESLRSILESQGNEIAALIMEPVKFSLPQPGYLSEVKMLCEAHGVIFILDEMWCGAKLAIGGGQEYFGVEAHLATWGKGIANGFSCCALTGKRELMELGGISKTGAKKVFLVSTTHGAESTGLAAMIATITRLKESTLLEENYSIGEAFYQQATLMIKNYEMEDYLEIVGDTRVVQTIKIKKYSKFSEAQLSTYVFREFHKSNVLYNGLFYFMAAHRNDELNSILTAFEGVVANLTDIVNKNNNLPEYNDVVKPVLRARI